MKTHTHTTARAGGLVLLAVIALLVVESGADTIFLKKGGKISGVISKETANSVEIKSGLGTIVLSRGAIARIERSAQEENVTLESQWQKEKEQEKAKAKESKLFEAEQRAQGMVNFHGTWISAEKAYEIEQGFARQKEVWEKSVEQQKKDLQEMEQRIKDLEARLEQKQRELDSREQQLAIKEQNLLLQQQNLQRQAEQFSRERQSGPPKLYSVPRIEVYPPSSE